MKFSFEISSGKNKAINLLDNARYTATQWINGLDFWTKTSSKAVKKLKEEGWGTNPYVYMVINDIAQTVARLTYEVKIGDRKIDNGNVYDLFYTPNKNQYLTEFLESLVTELLTTGEVIIHAAKPIGFSSIEEMNVLLSQCVEVFINPAVNEISYYQYTFNGKVTKYYPEEILHIKFANPIDTDGEKAFRGYAPLRILDRVTSASNSSFNAEASILENRGVQGFITGDVNLPLLDNEKELAQQAFNKQNNGSDKFGKIHVIGNNAKYVQVGANTADLQLLDSNPQKLRVICGVFKLAPQLFGDTASSTFNNMEEARKSAYIKCYLPTANFIVDQFNKWFSDVLNAREKISIDTTTIEAISKIDKVLSDKVTKEVQNGILSPQQALLILYPNLEFDKENAKPITNGQGNNN